MLKHSVIVAFLVSTSAFAALPPPQAVLPEGDRLVYTRVVAAYRKNQLDELLKQRQILERNYPNSVHIDNALYLQGMLEFQKARYGEAIHTFNYVTDHYAKSNKRPAALFAKGVTYERLNLKPLAIKVWETVMKDYPGSPEAQRAHMHLRMAKGALTK
jgi:TolA-binding protein